MHLCLPPRPCPSSGQTSFANTRHLFIFFFEDQSNCSEHLDFALLLPFTSPNLALHHKVATMVPTPFSETPEEEPLAPTVVVVTPYSTGCCIAKEIQNRGYRLICMWSAGFSEVMKTHVPKSADGLMWDLVLDEQDTLEDTANLVLREAASHGMDVVSCICGGEAGVDLADALSEHLGLLSNGTAVANRRDKKVQQELIKEAGLRSIRQVAGTSFTPEVDDFMRKESYPVVVKPLDSAGSDGVKMCKSYEEAKHHFLYLLNEHDMVNGGECHEVLCQEFLKGTEYVVDCVSRDSVHKTVMVWKYDKRPVNGAAFVYFGDIPVDSETEEAKVLIPYARRVLDALGCAHGPSHGEIIITEDGPCLVEMNCRAHGGDGIWQPLCRALTGGYNQVDATVDAILDRETFDRLPDKPVSPFLSNGQCVDLVSYKTGTVKATPGYSIMRLLPSFVCMESHIRPGSKVVPTVDLASDAGTLVVMNANKDVLARDIALIRQMETASVLFQLEDEDEQKEAMVIQKVLEKQKSAASTLGRPRSKSIETSTTRHRRLVSHDTPAMFMAAKHI
ncbi:Inherit from NOG: acetyl-CoA carboxylase biotin carboxylase [Seminavis robusta]|uniref:Inherit from NOG: acetyl-CoA carboxylase biotin carboxylase n=1 Tax=Seminavis robusta TaxID=568900 RepID=A0A9N8HC78_9STRA|nr:Inherit from NOG: acetyl-CoA carboxylase biotin carboxylase [Seminavis robusta]|eukprot:Sro395_g134060.1 Inherit from NOG: acetyl-CoA carboxylase biotin carboxylase (561) ;mRNA; r:28204-30293